MANGSMEGRNGAKNKKTLKKYALAAMTACAMVVLLMGFALFSAKFPYAISVGRYYYLDDDGSRIDFVLHVDNDFEYTQKDASGNLLAYWEGIWLFKYINPSESEKGSYIQLNAYRDATIINQFTYHYIDGSLYAGGEQIIYKI